MRVALEVFLSAPNSRAQVYGRVWACVGVYGVYRGAYVDVGLYHLHVVLIHVRSDVQVSADERLPHPPAQTRWDPCMHTSYIMHHASLHHYIMTSWIGIGLGLGERLYCGYHNGNHNDTGHRMGGGAPLLQSLVTFLLFRIVSHRGSTLSAHWAVRSSTSF